MPSPDALVAAPRRGARKTLVACLAASGALAAFQGSAWAQSALATCPAPSSAADRAVSDGVNGYEQASALPPGPARVEAFRRAAASFQAAVEQGALGASVYRARALLASGEPVGALDAWNAFTAQLPGGEIHALRCSHFHVRGDGSGAFGTDAQLYQLRSEINGRIAFVHFVCNVPDAEVFLDEQPTPVPCPHDYRLKAVNPRAIVVHGTAKDHQPIARTETVAPGATTVTFVFVHDSTPLNNTPATTHPTTDPTTNSTTLPVMTVDPTPPPQGMPGTRVAAIALTAGAAVLWGGTVGAIVLREDRARVAIDGQCDAATPLIENCGDIQREFNTANTLRTAGFIAAGSVTALAIGAWIIDATRPRAPRARSAVSWSCMPNAAMGLTCAGTF